MTVLCILLTEYHKYWSNISLILCTIL